MSRKKIENKWLAIRAEILDLKAQGFNAAEIAEKRHRSVDTIRSLLRKYAKQAQAVESAPTTQAPKVPDANPS